ncbi:Plastocyanin [uncultured archaeon]|nr:Plastocyanin [uncultured archaeon]
MLKNMIRGGYGYTPRIVIGIAVMALMLLSSGAVAEGKTWQVLAGGQTPDMALQGLGFYPGVITINEGDMINWTLGGDEVHTVSFMSGTPVPPPGSPESLNPAGGSSYDGSGFTSSGVILPGMSYSLNFTKAGVYTYLCLLHPGMGGVVVVQPAGSPYPFTQEQYTAQGQQELQADINTGQMLVNNLSLATTPGPNSTTIWHASVDIPLSTDADTLLTPQHNSSVTGNATLNFMGPGVLQVQVTVSGLAPNSTHPEHIHAGTCEAGGGIIIPLNNLTAGADGTATNTTTINGPPWLAVLSRGWFINVHQGPTMEGSGATSISCGDIVKHDAGYMRFTPDKLTIHTNDTVVWTQLNPMMIHTVTFPEAGQPVPEFILLSPNISINPVAAAPNGTSVYNGTGFFNSGVLEPGQNYSLMFTNPGTYEYVCLIHDNMGMTGNITVLPPEGTPTPTPTPGGTPPTGGVISGTKFNDVNGNGIKDQGEMGLSGWHIKLTGIVGTGIETRVLNLDATTNADGFYMFDKLPAGNYIVVEELQGGFVPVGSPVKNIMLADGENSENNNFFNRPVESLIPTLPSIAENYRQTDLVSDVPGLAKVTDPNLVNSWGIAHPPTGPWWVADNGMGVATLYNGMGQPFPPGNPLIVNIPPPEGGTGPSAPTGIVFNEGSDFAVTPGNPAAFIFVTEDGTISAWNRTVDPNNATLKVNNSPGAVYKGATIAKKGDANFLYVANFRGGSVDVFDTDFSPVTLAKDAFIDKNIPSGFAPFNVKNINGKIFVAFAQQDAQKHDNLDGAGLGFVDVFDPDGNLLMSLEHGDWMNAPWGIALAPSDFGRFSEHLLVGNFGSGQIAAFDPEDGNFQGLLRGTDGKPITIDGLWGLGFGNGATAGPANTLFFAAGINGEKDGLFGTVTPISNNG